MLELREGKKGDVTAELDALGVTTVTSVEETFTQVLSRK